MVFSRIVNSTDDSNKLLEIEILVAEISQDQGNPCFLIQEIL